jgi:DNA helicase-2/ATP-dependent DNA helicase PcrA
MDLMKGLNAQQQQAVMAGLGPILVIAGPGSGKTRVLTHRITYLIAHLGVRPYNILAVTFTNKAAREMANRVENLLAGGAISPSDGYPGGMPQVGTFHAFCARLLRREADHLPFDANFVIFDSDDQVSLVRQALVEQNIDEKRFRPQGVHASISNAKNELLLPDNYPQRDYRDRVVQQVYRRYQELLLVNNALDFDDLLLWTAFLLEQNPGVRNRYARRFEHVLVDEFQDTNQAQYTLLKHLASFHRNLFVVGDTDQSIYAWRGADYRNLLNFEKDYPDSQVILLEQNYRSTQAILDTAMAVIDRNPHRTRKNLFTDRGVGRKTILYEAYDDREEAAFVVETIARLSAGKQTRPGDFAIMYRTNAQSRILEEAFLRANLPYKLVGAQRFYGRREVKDVIAYLRLVHNPNDEVSLTRVINTPTRGIGEKTFITLRSLGSKLGRSAGEILLEMVTLPEAPGRAAFSGRALTAMLNFANLLAGWRALAEDTTPLTLMDRILADTDYRSFIDDGTEEGKDRWDNVMELRRLAAEYAERSLSEFLEEIALVSDQDTVETNASVPTLMTLHAAKGLEFPVVFIVGLVEGVLPHSRSKESSESMQEERRLFYVGITRAMDQLYLLTSQHRSAYGYTEPCEPSQFLEDIPGSLVDTPQTTTRFDGGRYGQSWSSRRADPSSRSTETASSPTLWQPANSSAGRREGAAGATPKSIRFPPGTKVVHPVWGDGMVLNSKLQDDEEVIDIFFEGVGLKKVAASLARLTIKE